MLPQCRDNRELWITCLCPVVAAGIFVGLVIGAAYLLEVAVLGTHEILSADAALRRNEHRG